MRFATTIIETFTPWLPIAALIIAISSLSLTALNYFAGRRERNRRTHETTPEVSAIINRKHYEGGWRSVQLHIVEPAEPLNFQCSNWRIGHAHLLKPTTAVLAGAKDDDYASGIFYADKPIRELRPDPPRPTLAGMRQAAPWLWVWCKNVHCWHSAPMALAPLVIRWGTGASSDVLRRSARCTCCGNKGADLQHPSARSSDIALAFHARAEDWLLCLTNGRVGCTGSAGACAVG